VCQGTLEEKIDNMIRIKKHLASSVLGGAGGEYALTEMSNKQLLNMISLDIHQAILNT
jgi:non-specific serine/threonine protein kinase